MPAEAQPGKNFLHYDYAAIEPLMIVSDVHRINDVLAPCKVALTDEEQKRIASFAVQGAHRG